jgi:hypothetical protein
MCFRAGGVSLVGVTGSGVTEGGARSGRVQSGSDLESFKAGSVVDTTPCLISKVSKWFKLLERTVWSGRCLFSCRRTSLFFCLQAFCLFSLAQPLPADLKLPSEVCGRYLPSSELMLCGRLRYLCVGLVGPSTFSWLRWWRDGSERAPDCSARPVIRHRSSPGATPPRPHSHPWCWRFSLAVEMPLW